MKNKKIFYGYWVLFACFLCALISTGCAQNSFSIFIKPLQAAMTWKRAEIIAAFTIFLISSGLLGPFSGRLIERHGAKKVISLGCLFTTAGLVVLSYMSDLWHYYTAYILIGAGWASTGQVTLSYVASHWFKKRRGLAVGILGMGMAASGLIFAPLIAIILIPNLGWRNSYLSLALLNCLIILPLTLLVIRTKPTDMGLHPDGNLTHEFDSFESYNVSPDQSPVSEGLSWKSALGTMAFWLIGISLLFNHFHLGIILGIYPHLTDIGFSEGIAASAFSFLCFASFFGMLFFGWLCDEISVKLAAGIGLGVIALGILIMLNIGPKSPLWLIWLFAGILGFGTGSYLPTMSLLTSTTFGIASYATLFGIMTFFQFAGAGTGPLITGIIYDITGSYFWAFTIILALVVLAIPLVMAVRPPANVSHNSENDKNTRGLKYDL